MKFKDVRTYTIQIHGRVEEEDVHATSPIQFAIERLEETHTTINLQTDQSGMIGLIRHLHGLGLMLISISCGLGNLPKNGSIPLGDQQE